MRIKKYLLTFYIILFSFFLKGQNICSFSPEEVNTLFCLSGYVNYTDNINASIVVENILSKINLKNTYFVTKVCKGINNAVAIKYKGIKYILLDVEWMESIKYGKNDWFHLFVIGHEMAHHLLKHTDNEKTTLLISRQNELDADEFSGYLLGVYGIEQKDINSLLVGFPDDNNPASTHPKKLNRINAIQKGYTSSKKTNSNALLLSLTKNADLNLTNIPYVLSLARRNYDSFIRSNDKKYLTQAIEYYKQALRFYEEPQISYELGAMFLSNGERDKYHSALELAYQKTKDEKYIIEMLGSYIESCDKNTENIILKYNKVISEINVKNISEQISISSMVKYYIFMASRNFDKEGIDTIYLNKAENLLSTSLRALSTKKLTTQKDFNNRADIYNGFGLSCLMKEAYDEGLKYFTKAKSDFESAQKCDSMKFENIYCYYSLNILKVNYNIALVNIRLREWKNSLNALMNYENILALLSPEKKMYLDKIMREDESGDIYYLKGRAFHGLGQYHDAINNYSLAIEFEKNNFALLFFRGLSYIGIDKMQEACLDFNIACKNGIGIACERFNTSCKKQTR